MNARKGVVLTLLLIGGLWAYATFGNRDFISVAVHRETDTVSWAYSSDSLAEADLQALISCHDELRRSEEPKSSLECETLTRVSGSNYTDSCVALFSGKDTFAHSKGHGGEREALKGRAKRACSAHASDCSFKYLLCTHTLRDHLQ